MRRPVFSNLLLVPSLLLFLQISASQVASAESRVAAISKSPIMAHISSVIRRFMRLRSSPAKP